MRSKFGGLIREGVLVSLPQPCSIDGVECPIC